MAELVDRLTLALLLNHARDLKFHNEQMTKAGFQRGNRLPQIELRGKTVLLIGLGGIGTQLAERCFAFGMRVLAVDPKDIPFMRAVEEVRKPDELNKLLPQADVVIRCTPLTPESKRTLGSKEFALMKDGVYIINVSRGLGGPCSEKSHRVACRIASLPSPTENVRSMRAMFP